VRNCGWTFGHSFQMTEKNGGDDGTRTRGLCRDRVTRIVFSATYKNIGGCQVAGRNYRNRKLWVGLWVGNCRFDTPHGWRRLAPKIHSKSPVVSPNL
jgi:hypothetical protein